MLNLDGVVKIYFVGIGGIAMSATAGIAKKFDYDVVGSDSSTVYAPSKDVLDEEQVPYFIGYDAKHIIDSKAHLYILSAGEGPENPEVAYILEHDLPRASFPELLYELTKEKLRIVVAGTHGKSTTTGMLGLMVKNLDDGSFMAGAVLQNSQSNFYFGDGHYFVFEGDEYKSQFDDPTPKFHYYKPDILVLTNLEYDHPDMFASLEDVQQEFRELIANMPDDGLIVYNADNEHLVKLVHESNVTSVSFGIENEADYYVEDIQYEQEFTQFDVRNKFSKDVTDQLLGLSEEYKIQLPGKINVYNALAVIATLRALGFSWQQVAIDLLTYKGVKRRFELVGVQNQITLIDDYAHHPTAVKETIDAARTRYPQSKIWAVFEPHTFSRTEATLPELTKAFESANEVLISDIYPAREKIKQGTITSKQVVEAIEKANPESSTNVRNVHTKQEALDVLKNEAKVGDVVIVMAVGSFNRLAYELKEIL